MARTPKQTDFYVDVEGVGRFRFARRTLMLEAEVQREYAMIAGGVDPTAWLMTLGEYISTLRVLIVEGPEDWDMDNMDGLDDDTYEKISKVFHALREREETFRRRHGAKGKAPGEGNGEHDQPVVSQDVPPTSEQPSVSGDNV